MSLSKHNWKSTAAALEMAGIVVFGVPATASAKAGPLPYGMQLLYIISRIIGPGPTQAIISNLQRNGVIGAVSFGLPPQGINITGPLNPQTFTGAGILIFDYAAKHFGLPYYSKYGVFVKVLGAGLLIVGVLGGLLDPTGTTGTSIGTAARGPGTGFAYSSPRAGTSPSVLGFGGIM